MKLATIGTGMIVNKFLEAVNRVDEIECTAVYSRSEKKAKELANRFNVEKTYTDFDKMLEDPTIDVVYVASPNSLHFKQSKQIILAKKHVICEKPLTSTVSELEELLALANENNVFFFEAIIPMHLPNFHLIKEKIDNIGEVKMVFSNFLQYSSKMEAFKKGETPNVFNPKFSGGALMDLNIYNLHFVMGLFGKPLNASYHPTLAENGIDVAGTLVLTYPTFNALCSAAKNVQADNYATIYGEKGSIEVIKEVSAIQKFNVVLDQTSTYNKQSEENGMVYEIVDFIRIINNKLMDEYQQLCDHSLSVYKVLHQSRKEANVIFDADKG